MEKTIFMNMCLIINGTKVLVQERKDEDWPGISFPGGHVETGESFTDAVIREVKEETGLTIHEAQLCGVKDWYSEDTRHVVLFYRTEKYTGELTHSEEGKVWWAELNDLMSLPLAHDMADMIRVFLEDQFSELFYSYSNDKWQKELK